MKMIGVTLKYVFILLLFSILGGHYWAENELENDVAFAAYYTSRSIDRLTSHNGLSVEDIARVVASDNPDNVLRQGVYDEIIKSMKDVVFKKDKASGAFYIGVPYLMESICDRASTSLYLKWRVWTKPDLECEEGVLWARATHHQ